MMERGNERRYNISLSPEMDEDLTAIADQLDISKAEAIRRALKLLKAAIDADSVKLVTGKSEKGVRFK